MRHVQLTSDGAQASYPEVDFLGREVTFLDAAQDCSGHGRHVENRPIDHSTRPQANLAEIDQFGAPTAEGNVRDPNRAVAYFETDTSRRSRRHQYTPVLPRHFVTTSVPTEPSTKCSRH